MAVSLRSSVCTLALIASVLGACSPTFNWRVLRLEGAPLDALMPCKPEKASRTVPMLGQPTVLHMHSCETGGLTFAVAWAALGDAARASEALDQWQVASLASTHVGPGASMEWVVSLPGADRVRGIKALGRDHLGQPLQTQVMYFSQANRVYQVAVYGPKLPEQVTEAFFDGLALP